MLRAPLYSLFLVQATKRRTQAPGSLEGIPPVPSRGPGSRLFF